MIHQLPAGKTSPFSYRSLTVPASFFVAAPLRRAYRWELLLVPARIGIVPAPWGRIPDLFLV
ncbi:MAG: hypothetical protein GKC05_05120 [Methanomicrobiales archaeon]|nr:hypothetical protein [Methanomicrobiales archaeon]NYT21450.1 hypothetical protein [Methanomicrobiales archaeon]